VKRIPVWAALLFVLASLSVSLARDAESPLALMGWVAIQTNLVGKSSPFCKTLKARYASAFYPKNRNSKRILIDTIQLGSRETIDGAMTTFDDLIENSVLFWTTEWVSDFGESRIFKRYRDSNFFYVVDLGTYRPSDFSDILTSVCLTAVSSR
jgi:hypothetical protein